MLSHIKDKFIGIYFLIFIVTFNFNANASQYFYRVFGYIDHGNRPEILNASKAHYHSLPKEGKALKKPWTSFYWANYLGRTSWRWQDGFRYFWGRLRTRRTYYRILNEKKVKKMSREEIAKLSPSEKFDIYLGRYTFDLTKSEKKYMRGSLIWHGMCHGVSPASIAEEEPGQVASMLNPDGIEVIFYRDDIKALLARAYTDVGGVNLMGHRYREHLGRNSKEYRDVHPAAFHLSVGQIIGERGETFNIDKEKGKEVWNHPIRRYKFQYYNFRKLKSTRGRYSRRAEETTHLVDVVMEFYITKKIYPQINNTQDAEEQFRVRYDLELDKDGIIIGGEWHSTKYPDFAWRTFEEPSYEDELIPFGKVREILSSSN